MSPRQLSPQLRRASLFLLPLAIASGVVLLGMPSAAGTAPTTAGRAVAPPSVTLTSQRIELGTLGEPGAYATAVSGNVVVGTATPPSSDFPSRAFAYDLDATTPRMRALNTPEGDLSYATDIDGSIVVGEWIKQGDGVSHAFAYDLAAADPRMLDLGDLGGGSSSATAVDGTVVVGNAAAPDGSRRAFAYDLSSADPAMRDLGTLGGGFSYASAVDDGVVVGGSYRDDFSGDLRAFAYDLEAASPHMQDLGTLPGATGSYATAVSGPVVVGRATTDRSGEAFAIDLDATAPQVRGLGTLGGPFSSATDIDGSIVVGDSRTPGRIPRAFASDLSLATPRMRDLGTLGRDFSFAAAVSGDIVVGRAGNYPPFGHSTIGLGRAFAFDLSPSVDRITDLDMPPAHKSGAVAVDGNVAVGSAYDEGTGQRAVAWRLSRTTAPAMRFSEFTSTVNEDTGTALVTVVRDGDSSPPVTVDFATRADSAITGRDFTATAGTLSFAAGQTEQTFAVPIVNDAILEQAQAFLVDLTNPSDGAVLGTPRTAEVTIDDSDQQPDALITIPGHPRFIGNDIYNATAVGQTAVRDGRRGQIRTFYVRIHNDGTQTNTLTLRGSQPRNGSRIRYTQGDIDVTTAVQSSTGLPLSIAPGTDYRQIRVQITIRRDAPLRHYQPATVTATWTGDDTRTDRAKASVRVVP